MVWDPANYEGQDRLQHIEKHTGIHATAVNSGSLPIGNYGGVADCQQRSDAAITTGTTALTSATATFTSADVGKTVLVTAAGAAGDDLRTTIAAYVSATAVTLADAAGATVSGNDVYWGTDNKAAIDAALAALTPSLTGGRRVGGNKIVLQPGSILTSGGHTIPFSVQIVGAGAQATNVVHTGNNTCFKINGGSSITNYQRQGISGFTLWGNSGASGIGVELIGKLQFPFIEHVVIGNYTNGIGLQLHSSAAGDFIEGVLCVDYHSRYNKTGIQWKRDSGDQSFAYGRFLDFKIHVPLNGTALDVGSNSAGTCYLNGCIFRGIIWLEGNNAVALNVGANGKIDPTTDFDIVGEITGSPTGVKSLQIASGGIFYPRGGSRGLTFLNTPTQDVASATTFRPANRIDERLSIQGVFAETFPRVLSGGQTILATGTIQGGIVQLRRNDPPVTNVVVAVNTNASSVTLTRVGIRNLRTGSLLASSAESSSLFTAGTVPRAQAVPLSPAFYPTDDDTYGVEIIFVGTTPAILVWGTNISSGLTAVGSGVVPAYQKSGQTDLPGTMTITGTGVAYWFGVS